ncbi:MAG: hypothetical protein EA425_07930 [Puniceicoccaceae bacterium]|nr:MAG: hypothetical protein EA425_07930 [Puniceicoccaceae bacterium]
MAFGFFASLAAGSAEPVSHTVEFLGYTSPGYVLDADEFNPGSGYNRDMIRVRMRVAFDNPGANVDQVHGFAGFRLIDVETGEAVSLRDETSMEPPQVLTDPMVFAIPAGANNEIITIDHFVRPAERLNPYTTYRVEGDFFWEVGEIIQSLGPEQSVVANSFIHFTGAPGADPNLNAVALLQSVTITDRSIFGPNASDTFAAEVGFRLYRYDSPTLPATNDTIPVIFRLEMVDGNDEVIAVADTFVNAAPQPTLNSYSFAFVPPFQRPQTTAFTRLVQFRPEPGVQLDSVNHQYRLRAQISHLERPPPTPLVLPGNTVDSAPAQLLHFSGRLLFGTGNAQIATMVSEITNDPSIGANNVGSEIHTVWNVPADAGSIEGMPGHTYGQNGIPVGLLPNGDAAYRGGANIAVTPPSLPDFGEVANVRYFRISTRLTPNGAETTAVQPFFPAGFGFANSPHATRLNPAIPFANVPLNQSLDPLINPVINVPPTSELWVVEESKPVAARMSALTWNVPLGRFEGTPWTEGTNNARAVFGNLYQEMDAAPVPGTKKIKHSNDQYWRSAIAVGGTYRVASVGSAKGARLTATFTLGSGQVRMHAPFASEAVFESGQVAVSSDLVNTANSWLQLFPGDSVVVRFPADCRSPGCGAGLGFQTANFRPDNDRLRIHQEGGLIAEGVFPSPFILRWAWQSGANVYTHRASDFIEATFASSGHFLRGGSSSLSANLRPAVIHLSGVNRNNGQIAERAGTTAYQNGLHDYAGLNFRAGPVSDNAASPVEGFSYLAGSPYGWYTLKNRSKYYLRFGGVSGIHDQIAMDPAKVFLSGYDFTLSSFGLAFLDTEVVDSRTEGTLYLPHPSDYDLDFEELTFLCHGALDGMKVAGGQQSVIAAYWNAPLDVFAMQFVQEPGQECDPSNAFLTLGTATFSAHMPEVLYGTIGVFPHGNLIPAARGIPDLARASKRPPKPPCAGRSASPPTPPIPTKRTPSSRSPSPISMSPVWRRISSIRRLLRSPSVS